MNTDKLRGIIVERGFTQEKIAKEIGITPKTFYTKMKKGVFGTDEVMCMIELLKIENPAETFLSQK